MIILVTRNRIFKKILRERDILKLWDEGFTRLTNVIREKQDLGFVLKEGRVEKMKRQTSLNWGLSRSLHALS